MVQFRVEAKGAETQGFKKIVDKEREARLLYGRTVKKISDDEHGFVRLFQREDPKSEWVLIQEYEQDGN